MVALKKFQLPRMRKTSRNRAIRSKRFFSSLLTSADQQLKVLETKKSMTSGINKREYKNINTFAKVIAIYYIYICNIYIYIIYI